MIHYSPKLLFSPVVFSSSLAFLTQLVAMGAEASANPTFVVVVDR